jgi:hypothetical protein
MLTPRFLAASVIAFGIGGAGALAELPGLAERFGQFDADGDGKLDRVELAALLAAIR